MASGADSPTSSSRSARTSSPTSEGRTRGPSGWRACCRSSSQKRSHHRNQPRHQNERPHADPRRLRAQLPTPPAHADDLDAQRAPQPGLGPRASGPHEDDAVGADGRLPRQVRQLVHPPGGPGGTFSGDQRRDHQRRRRARSGRALRHSAPRATAARGDVAVPAGEPLLRDRQDVPVRLGQVLQRPARLGARAGDLRLRSPAHPVRLPVRPPDQDRLGGVQRAQGASAATSPTWPSPSAAA